jgi:1,4-alpha-glucan branching enzyme
LHAGIIQLDGYLAPFKDALKSRFSKAQNWIKTINETEGGLEKFSRASSLHTSMVGVWLTAPAGL